MWSKRSIRLGPLAVLGNLAIKRTFRPGNGTVRINNSRSPGYPNPVRREKVDKGPTILIGGRVWDFEHGNMITLPEILKQWLE